jgi:hypothetical protein
MAIAEHHPEMLHEKNKGMMEMKKEEMHKMASTKEEGLPMSRKSTQKRYEEKRMKSGAKHH